MLNSWLTWSNFLLKCFEFSVFLFKSTWIYIQYGNVSKSRPKLAKIHVIHVKINVKWIGIYEGIFINKRELHEYSFSSCIHKCCPDVKGWPKHAEQYRYCKFEHDMTGARHPYMRPRCLGRHFVNKIFRGAVIPYHWREQTLAIACMCLSK